LDDRGITSALDAITKSNGSLIDMVSYECTVSHGLENYIIAMRRGNNLNPHNNNRFGDDLSGGFNHLRLAPPSAIGGSHRSLHSSHGNAVGSNAVFNASAYSPAAVSRPSPNVFNIAGNERVTSHYRNESHGIMPPASVRPVQHQFPVPVRYSSSSIIDREPHHLQFSHGNGNNTFGREDLRTGHDQGFPADFSLPLAGRDGGWDHFMPSYEEKKYTLRDVSSSVGSTSPFEFGIDHSPPLSSSSSSSICNAFSSSFASTSTSTSTSAASLTEELKYLF
jgi:hypothetical protein